MRGAWGWCLLRKRGGEGNRDERATEGGMANSVNVEYRKEGGEKLKGLQLGKRGPPRLTK